jgi:ribonuclease P protein component
MLPKIKRITKEDFLFIIKNGKILHGSFFYLKYINSEKPKYSFVFPKTLSKLAVIRNKYRRLGYNILLKTDLKPIWGIFFYKKESFLAKKEDIEIDILNILNKI